MMLISSAVNEDRSGLRRLMYSFFGLPKCSVSTMTMAPSLRRFSKTGSVALATGPNCRFTNLAPEMGFPRDRKEFNSEYQRILFSLVAPRTLGLGEIEQT